ncbi:MAG: peptidyl-prolyl cis-trans isomerase [Alphaproteobacteria bacterium]|nr:MAG: peptidyl-prolyl cis-trans isomerase [Alphaproteobacteria bacterium]
MKKLLKDPLTHFLVVGLSLFLVFNLVAPDDVLKNDPNTIVVDRDAILTFMQYRAKAFDTERFEAMLDAMPENDLQLMIDDYVREEVLHREALALGLGVDDYVIKQRMIQKVEFLARGFAEAISDLDELQVRAYFEENKGVYYIQPYATFTHVFFDRERHSPDDLSALAKDKLVELNTNNVVFSDAVRHGERFPYHVNYVERTPDYVASHFGRAMAASVFESEADATTWRGPYQSPYGVHLVLVTKNVPGRTPELEEVYNRVEQDATRAAINERTEMAISEILKSYEVKVDLTRPDPTKLAEQEK